MAELMKRCDPDSFSREEWAALTDLILKPKPAPRWVRDALRSQKAEKLKPDTLGVINTILNFCWDPLAITHYHLAEGRKLDEYIQYAFDVLPLLERKASVQEVAEFLANIVAQWMEQEPFHYRELKTAHFLCAIPLEDTRHV